MSRYRWPILFVMALIFVALAWVWMSPSRPNGPWAELSVADVDVDQNGISITVDAEMPLADYVSLTCPWPTIAADEPDLKKGDTLECRRYYYICKLPDEVGVQQRDDLQAGFKISKGEKILLSSEMPQAVVFDGYLGADHYQMTLKLTDRPS